MHTSRTISFGGSGAAAAAAGARKRPLAARSSLMRFAISAAPSARPAGGAAGVGTTPAPAGKIAAAIEADACAAAPKMDACWVVAAAGCCGGGAATSHFLRLGRGGSMLPATVATLGTASAPATVAVGIRTDECNGFVPHLKVSAATKGRKRQHRQQHQQSSASSLLYCSCQLSWPVANCTRTCTAYYSTYYDYGYLQYEYCR